MKKKLIMIILAIVICECVLVAGVLAFLLSPRHPAQPTQSEQSIEAYTQSKLKNSSYNIKAEVSLSEKTVTVKEELVLDKAASKLLVYLPSANLAPTKILRAFTGDETFSTTRKDTMLEIQCPEPQSSIHLEYQITLQENNETLSYASGIYYLTNFLATPAVYRNNIPVTTYSKPFGDPYIYDINNYYILFKVDKDLHIAAPGDQEEHPFGSNKITIFQAPNLRDFSAVLYHKADVYKETHNHTNFIFINTREVKTDVETAFDFANKNIGPYPYDNLFVVKAPLAQNKGMEFSNMVFISEKCFNNREDLKRVSYHEVFHQWFYGIIGTDQLEEPFFDEGLVNCLSLLLCNAPQSSAYSSRLFSMQLKDYASRDDYYALAYNEASNYFYSIWQKLGNNFYNVLKKLYLNKKYQTAYFSDFVKYTDDYAKGK